METINIKIIHPTSSSDTDIGLPENILLRDVFSQLIDANFLNSGQPYGGVLMPSGTHKDCVLLDNNMTVSENGIDNNDTIQTFITRQVRSRFDAVEIVDLETINIKIIHPTNNSDIDIGLPGNMLLRDVFSQLIDANFLSAGQHYTGVLKPSGTRKENIPLDNNKTANENGISNNDTIQTIIATQAGGGFDSIIDLWQSFYPYLDQVGTVLGVVGATVGFGVWVRNKFGKSYTPKQFIMIITDKEFWNAHELSIKLDITDEEAKNLLKGFGYCWNKQFSLYYKTEKTVEIIEKIEKGNK